MSLHPPDQRLRQLCNLHRVHGGGGGGHLLCQGSGVRGCQSTLEHRPAKCSGYVTSATFAHHCEVCAGDIIPVLAKALQTDGLASLQTAERVTERAAVHIVSGWAPCCCAQLTFKPPRLYRGFWTQREHARRKHIASHACHGKAAPCVTFFACHF